MRIPLLLSVLLVATSASPALAQLTPQERQRLAAHLEMTASWLRDEVAGLSPAQLEFRRAPGTWNVLEVLDHLVLVDDIYWNDLQKGAKTPLAGRVLTSRDADILWYGIDRTNREAAIPTETPKGTVRAATQAIEMYRKQHDRLLHYVKTTRDDLRNWFVERQGCDAYQWAPLISTHVQRHILQIREVKADPRFPKS